MCHHWQVVQTTWKYGAVVSHLLQTLPAANDLCAAMANSAAPGGMRPFLQAVSAVLVEARTSLRVAQMEGSSLNPRRRQTPPRCCRAPPWSGSASWAGSLRTSNPGKNFTSRFASTSASCIALPLSVWYTGLLGRRSPVCYAAMLRLSSSVPGMSGKKRSGPLIHQWTVKIISENNGSAWKFMTVDLGSHGRWRARCFDRES
jgi:hypothetical protein